MRQSSSRWLLFIVGLVLIAGLLPPTLVSAQPDTQSGGYYYTVQRGDTWSIVARRTGVTVARLKALNPAAIHPRDWLWVGDRLFIPGPARPPAKPGTPAVGYWYTVKAGDTWYIVSRNTGVPILELWHANPAIKRPNQWLYTGDRVWIPRAPRPAAPAVARPAPTAAPAIPPTPTMMPAAPALAPATAAITPTVAPASPATATPTSLPLVPATAAVVPTSIATTAPSPLPAAPATSAVIPTVIVTAIPLPSSTPTPARAATSAPAASATPTAVPPVQGTVVIPGASPAVSGALTPAAPLAVTPTPTAAQPAAQAPAAPATAALPTAPPTPAAASTVVPAGPTVAATAVPPAAGAVATPAARAAACPADLAAYPPAITAYLNQPGSNVAGLQAWLTQCKVISADLGAVMPADIQRANRVDVVVAIHDLAAAQIAPPGKLLIYFAGSSGYVLAGQADGIGKLGVLRVEDVNQDGKTDIVWTDATCGASTCSSTLFVDSWDGSVFRDWIEGEPTLAEATYTFSDTVPSGTGLEIIARGGVMGSVGAGPQRSTTQTWASIDGKPYSQQSQVSDASSCLYHRILDANALFDNWAKGGFAPAIQAYEAAIADTSLQACGQVSDELNLLRDFARFRLVVARVGSGMVQQATVTQAEIKATALAATGKAFLDSYASSRSVVQACREANAFAKANPAAWEFMASFGYGNPGFTAADMCPLDR